jgi:hypothetical protein
LLSDGGAGNGGTLATLQAAIAAPAGSTTLTFKSTVPADVIVGTSVADTTSPDTGVIPALSQVSALPTSTTVTLSNPVTAIVTVNTDAPTKAGNAVLEFSSTKFPTSVAAGMPLVDNTTASVIPAGTTVILVTTGGARGSTCPSKTTCVTLSGGVTGAGVQSGDAIAFGGVEVNDSITFGKNNQCNEAITAAQNAAKAGTWVYAIAYGSGLGDFQADTVANNSDFSSCSDTETPLVNSCYTMSQIASSPGAVPDPSRFYSDPMAGGTTPNPSQYCVSPGNPSATNVPAIFSAIGYSLTHTLLVGCGTTAAGGYC